MKPRIRKHPLWPGWFICFNDRARGSGPSMAYAYGAFLGADFYAKSKERAAQ